MVSNISFKVLNWEDSFNISLYLFEKIKQDGFQPDVILGIARGGWIPGRLFADFFKLKQTSNIKIEFYREIGETATDPIIKQFPGEELSGRKILIVDDVADTGRSLKVAVKHLKSLNIGDFKIVTLFMKPQSIVKPDYYFKETTDWIIYPWEFFEFIDEMSEKLKEEYPEKNQVKQKIKDIGLPPGIVDIFFERYR
jgi:uncharacterized protein